MKLNKIGVWFIAIRTGTGSDVFTERLIDALTRCGIRAQAHWLPHHAEFAPWSVPIPERPAWATIAHINSWLPKRLIPKGIPVVCTVHSIVHASHLRRYKTMAQAAYHRLWVRRCEQHSINSATEVTAVSHHVAEHVKAEFGRTAKVVFNWVDTERFSPPSGKMAKSAFQVLYVGTVRILKGIDILPLLAKELGTGFEITATVSETQMQRFGPVPENLRCIGRLDESSLCEFYGQSDVLIFPSRAEGFGLVALEAQACGTPVVATKGSAIPEVVQDGVTGLLCAVDDVQTFANAIRKLKSDPALLQSMSLAAMKRASTEFNEAAAIDLYSKIYISALESAGGILDHQIQH